MRLMNILAILAICGFAACAVIREPGVPEEATAVALAGTRLPADIQSRASSLTWADRWVGDGVALFTTQVVAREALGEQAVAAAWLCDTYESLADSGASNPALAPGDGAAQNAAWGALWWHGLRNELSDAGLRDLLHILATRQGTSPVRIDDIESAVDDVMRRDMSSIFEPWMTAQLIGETPVAAPCGDDAESK